jgi:hypothetical protein
VKEREEKELQLQKAERAELKKVNKLHKARTLQEKRMERAEAKVAREHEKAEQAASRAQKQSAQKAKKALQQRIKPASKGNKQAVRLPITTKKWKEQALKVVGDVEDPGVTSAARPVTTRRGRSIFLSRLGGYLSAIVTAQV